MNIAFVLCVKVIPISCTSAILERLACTSCAVEIPTRNIVFTWARVLRTGENSIENVKTRDRRKSF